MPELKLHGADDSGAHLVLRDDAGAEYLLALDERLFVEVRRARSRDGSGVTPAERGGDVRPKDVQAMIRAGLSIEDVIAETGADRAFVARYEGPVLAERAHIAERARRTLVYPENRPEGSPRPLLELCTERLEMREVDLDTLSWDAWRQPDGQWTVELAFEAAGRPRAAEWVFHSGALTPQNEEALWLSDGGPTDTGPIPSYGPAGERVFNIQADRSGVRSSEDRTAPQASHAAETGRILEQLRQRRGRPQPERTADPADTPVSSVDAQDFRDSRVSRHGTLHAVQEDSTDYADQPDSMPGAHAATPEETAEAEIFALPQPGVARGGTPYGGDAEQQATASSTEAEEADAEAARPTLDDQLSLLDDDQLGRQDHESGYESAKYDTLPVRDEDGRLDALRSPDAPRSEEDRRKSRRARVPSWDEIMFGGKRD